MRATLPASAGAPTLDGGVAAITKAHMRLPKEVTLQSGHLLLNVTFLVESDFLNEKSLECKNALTEVLMMLRM